MKKFLESASLHGDNYSFYLKNKPSGNIKTDIRTLLTELSTSELDESPFTTIKSWDKLRLETFFKLYNLKRDHSIYRCNTKQEISDYIGMANANMVEKANKNALRNIKKYNIECALQKIEDFYIYE